MLRFVEENKNSDKIVEVFLRTRTNGSINVDLWEDVEIDGLATDKDGRIKVIHNDH